MSYFKTEKEKDAAMKWFNSLSEDAKIVVLKNLHLINPNRKEIHKLWKSSPNFVNWISNL